MYCWRMGCVVTCRIIVILEVGSEHTSEVEVGILALQQEVLTVSWARTPQTSMSEDNIGFCVCMECI